ncbi:MAG: hypothetical protein ACYDD1_19120 [Caulobacteraceae bacterium]
MNAVTIPADLHAWAEAEVAAGRAMTVEQVTERALRGYRSQLEQLRRSVDDADVPADGGQAIDDGFNLPTEFRDEHGDRMRWDVVHASLTHELAEAEAGRPFSAEEVFADIAAKLDFARDQVARGEALDGDAFLAELDSWIAQDVAAEPKV